MEKENYRIVDSLGGDSSRGGSRFRADSGLSTNRTDARSSKRMVEYRGHSPDRLNDFRDCSKEEGGFIMSKKDERIANIIIGAIGYTAGIIMLLIGAGLLPAP